MILNRLEIDVMQINELQTAAELAFKYHMPALVVHPQLAAQAHILRGQSGGRYKLITPVDWPKGESFGSLKVRGLELDALEADGFEFLLTGGKSESDNKNEVRLLHDFVRHNLPQNTEIRFVVGRFLNDEEDALKMCRALKNVPTPAYIRNDPAVKMQVSKANPEVHNDFTAKIKEVISAPIKVSGNINSVRALMSCKGAAKFAVNVSQAKQIIKEFNQQPEQLKEMLGTA